MKTEVVLKLELLLSGELEQGLMKTEVVLKSLVGSCIYNGMESLMKTEVVLK